ncbi:MAG TPA: glycerol-3-phosphate 1-O-acyltransferase PlsY [Methylococcaceae bacterium]|nr:glycerol-3-phosphate 1-O-acyltransferase PlsY [Methylococcaceae bacterium]
MMGQWLWIPAAYLIGSLSSAVLVSRLMGLPDPREGGSKNPGATNVLRLGGKKAGALTLFGDWLKGWLPVMLAGATGAEPQVVALTLLAAFFGHLYPVFFGFKGGKGVSTAFGVLTGAYWLMGLATAATWTLTAALTRYSSLGSLVGAVLAPVYAHFMVGSLPLTAATALMSTILIFRHKGNIQRLLAGQESKIGQKST